MDQWISLLWAARCLGRIGVRDCRCSLVRPPLWAAHWSARTALLCSANAGVGDALRSLHPNAEEFRCSAVRAPLWAARCHCRSGMPTCVTVDHVCLRRQDSVGTDAKMCCVGRCGVGCWLTKTVFCESKRLLLLTLKFIDPQKISRVVRCKAMCAKFFGSGRM